MKNEFVIFSKNPVKRSLNESKRNANDLVTVSIVMMVNVRRTLNLAVGQIMSLRKQRFLQIVEDPFEDAGTVVRAVYAALQLHPHILAILELLAQQLLSTDVAALAEQTFLFDI